MTDAKLDRKCGRNRRLLSALLTVVAALALTWASRAPVVLVADDAFLALYGRSAAAQRMALAALRLWRRVKLAELAVDADPRAAADAVEFSSRRPFCAVFPDRYRQAAGEYARRNPGVRTVLFGSGPEIAENLLFVATDGAADLFRAGRAAAALAAGGGGPPAWIGGPAAGAAERSAFAAGLAAGGYDGPPHLVGPSVPVPADACCLVVSRTAGELPELAGTGPLIVFSWLEAELLPRRTILRFDDSPPALLVPAVRAAAAGKQGLSVPSAAELFRSRVPDSRPGRRLRAGLTRFSGGYPERNNNSL